MSYNIQMNKNNKIYQVKNKRSWNLKKALKKEKIS